MKGFLRELQSDMTGAETAGGLLRTGHVSSCIFSGDSGMKTGPTKGRSPIPVFTTQKDGFQVLIV